MLIKSSLIEGFYSEIGKKTRIFSTAKGVKAK